MLVRETWPDTFWTISPRTPLRRSPFPRRADRIGRVWCPLAQPNQQPPSACRSLASGLARARVPLGPRSRRLQTRAASGSHRWLLGRRLDLASRHVEVHTGWLLRHSGRTIPFAVRSDLGTVSFLGNYSLGPKKKCLLVSFLSKLAHYKMLPLSFLPLVPN